MSRLASHEIETISITSEWFGLLKFLKPKVKREMTSVTLRLSALSQQQLARWLDMTPVEFSLLSRPEMIKMLNVIVPEIERLSRELDDLSHLFKMLADNRIINLAEMVQNSILQFKNVLVAITSAPSVPYKQVIEELEAQKPELKRLIEKIIKKKTTIATRVLKTTTEAMSAGNPKRFPTGTPFKVSHVDYRDELKVAGLISMFDSISRKLGNRLVELWNSMKENLSEYLTGLMTDLNEAAKVLDDISADLQRLI
jgi:hypothetical protein